MYAYCGHCIPDKEIKETLKQQNFLRGVKHE